MELSNEVDRAMMEWSRWMRNNDNVQGYPSSDVSYKLSQAGYAGTGRGGQRELPPMPDVVEVVDNAVKHLPVELREFVRCWWGVDRYRTIVNPCAYNEHSSLLAKRRAIVGKALRVTRQTRTRYEKRVQELLQCGVGASIAYMVV